jgi:hypothetical protein
VRRDEEFCPVAARNLADCNQNSCKTPVTLYAANVPVTRSADLAALSSGLGGSAALSLPADPAVMQRVQEGQVFLVLQYHFGAT